MHGCLPSKTLHVQIHSKIACSKIIERIKQPHSALELVHFQVWREAKLLLYETNGSNRLVRHPNLKPDILCSLCDGGLFLKVGVSFRERRSCRPLVFFFGHGKVVSFFHNIFYLRKIWMLRHRYSSCQTNLWLYISTASLHSVAQQILRRQMARAPIRLEVIRKSQRIALYVTRHVDREAYPGGFFARNGFCH